MPVRVIVAIAAGRSWHESAADHRSAADCRYLAVERVRDQLETFGCSAKDAAEDGITEALSDTKRIEWPTHAFTPSSALRTLSVSVIQPLGKNPLSLQVGHERVEGLRLFTRSLRARFAVNLFLKRKIWNFFTKFLLCI